MKKSLLRIELIKFIISIFTNPHNSKSFSLIEALFRFYTAYIMITNAPVGTFIPLKNLNLDNSSYEFLMRLWQMGGLMHLTKLLEFIGGLLLLFSKTSLVAVLLLLPVVIGISNITFGLWGGLGMQHWIMLISISLTLVIHAQKLTNLWAMTLKTK